MAPELEELDEEELDELELLDDELLEDDELLLDELEEDELLDELDELLLEELLLELSPPGDAVLPPHPAKMAQLVRRPAISIGDFRRLYMVFVLLVRTYCNCP